MTQYIAKRLWQGIIALFFLVTFIFLMPRFNGNPADLFLSPDATDEELEILTEQLALNRPSHIQYYEFITRDIRGDLANSINMEDQLPSFFPNVFNTFMVLFSLQMGRCILAEATLSFLGTGMPPTPFWSRMVSKGRDDVTSVWHLCCLPGSALALTVLAFNHFGDWLRDRLGPKLRQL